MTDSRPSCCHSANAVAFDDVDLQPAGIELQDGGVGDPGIGLELVAHGGGIEEQQRRAAVDAADREHLVLAQLLAAVDGDRRDAESGGIRQRVSGIAERCDQCVDMTALDDTKAGAAEQHQHGQGDAGAVRKMALEQEDQAVGRLAIDHGPRRDAGAKAQPLAQQHDRSNSGGFQVSLGPQRSQRSSEASCTIHCTSSSNVVPAQSLAGSGTCDVSVMPGSGWTSGWKRPIFPRCGRRSGNPQQLTPRQPSATCAASVNLRTSW